MDLSSLGEFGVIDRIRAATTSNAAVGIGDDAAVVECRSGRLVATVDALVEGRHFRLDWSSPADVGYKSAAVNVSDLAAMGAMPRHLLLSLAVPASTTIEFIDGLYVGVRQACDDFEVELIGGDTVSSPHLVLSVTALGEIDGDPMLRSNVGPDDVIAVTGELGRAAAGIAALEAGLDTPEAQRCVAVHRRPIARVGEGLALRRKGVRAAMDVSDGLFSDIRRLAEMSDVGFELYADDVPLHPDAESVASQLSLSARDFSCGGGEDTELLVALPPDSLPIPGVWLTVIGRATPTGLTMTTAEGTVDLPDTGWDHFRS